MVFRPSETELKRTAAGPSDFSIWMNPTPRVRYAELLQTRLPGVQHTNRNDCADVYATCHRWCLGGLEWELGLSVNFPAGVLDEQEGGSGMSGQQLCEQGE